MRIGKYNFNKKGVTAVLLASTLAVNTVLFVGYKALDLATDVVVAEFAETAVEVHIAWGTEVAGIVEAIESVNGELNGPKRKQAINEFHDLNNTWNIAHDLSQVQAGTYLVPVIK